MEKSWNVLFCFFFLHSTLRLGFSFLNTLSRFSLLTVYRGFWECALTEENLHCSALQGTAIVVSYLFGSMTRPYMNFPFFIFHLMKFHLPKNGGLFFFGRGKVSHLFSDWYISLHNRGVKTYGLWVLFFKLGSTMPRQPFVVFSNFFFIYYFFFFLEKRCGEGWQMGLLCCHATVSFSCVCVGIDQMPLLYLFVWSYVHLLFFLIQSNHRTPPPPDICFFFLQSKNSFQSDKPCYVTISSTFIDWERKKKTWKGRNKLTFYLFSPLSWSHVFVFWIEKPVELAHD